MQLSSENDLRNCVNVFSESPVEQQSLWNLQFVEMLQQRFQLVFEDLVELLSYILLFDFVELLNTLNEKLKLFEDLFEDLDVLVINWLVKQIVETKAAGNDEHEAFVQLGCNIEKSFVVVFELEAVVLDVVDHAHLLLIEEFPDFEDVFEMMARYFVEMAFQSWQFLFVLFF